MPRFEYVLAQRTEPYLDMLRARKMARPSTITEYRRLLRQALTSWHDAGMEWNPARIGEEEIEHLMQEVYGHLEPHNARTQLSIIGTFLKRNGNPIVDNMDIPWPQALRINVKWLEPFQAMNLIKNAQGMERMLVHCELQLLMRRCEVMRLKVEDVSRNAVQVWGKGRMGGKPRTIPFHPRTMDELAACLKLRESMIGEATRKRGYVEVPKELLIYERHGRLGAYQATAVDNLLKRAAHRAGLPLEDVSNHVLRRAGGRMMWLAGERVTTIMRILGHSSETQTIQYLGINMDDMRSGMERSEQYWSAQEINAKTGTNGR